MCDEHPLSSSFGHKIPPVDLPSAAPRPFQVAFPIPLDHFLTPRTKQSLKSTQSPSPTTKPTQGPRSQTTLNPLSSQPANFPPSSTIADPLETVSQFPQEELQRQWRWAVAEELLPLSKEEKIEQILEDVSRMEVWIDNVAEKVKVIKMKLDEMEEEGGIILTPLRLFLG